MRRLLLSASIVLLSFSCSRSSETQPKLSQIVSDMISDQLSPETSIFKRYGWSDRTGGIFLIGQPEDCMLLCGELLNCDNRDNYDGSFKPDGLKDFAGEMISCVMDDSTSAADGEYVVRQYLSALDTLCFVSDYDKNGLGVKGHPKVVVLTSARCAGEAGGLFEIDSLSRYFGSNIVVFNPFYDAVCEAVADGADVIGVVGGEENVASGLYEKIVCKRCVDMGVRAECFAFCPAEGDNALIAFLNEYIASGNTKPIDVLIFDNFSKIGFDENDALLKINSILNVESVLYSDFISEDFHMVSLRENAGRECYDILRTNNLFTHNISQPVSESFTARRDTSVSAGIRLDYFRKPEGKCIR